jgi:hypothetical protein
MARPPKPPLSRERIVARWRSWTRRAAGGLHLDQAHLLARHRQWVDDGAFEAGPQAIVEGLAARFPG